MKVYEGTLNGYSKVTTEDLKKAVIEAKSQLRPGIGSRSKLIFTHTSNLNEVRAIVHYITEKSQEIAVCYPFRVIGSDYIPPYVKVKIGVEYKDNRFVSFSAGPSTDMSVQDYESMCLYFGWASETFINMPVWYELEAPYFGDFFDIASEINTIPECEKPNLQIARNVVDKYANYIKDNDKVKFLRSI